MQDGYHFTNAPWLIGDGQPQANLPPENQPDPWAVPIAGAIRQGQMVRIGSKLAETTISPMMLEPEDRRDDGPFQGVMPSSNMPDPSSDAKTGMPTKPEAESSLSIAAIAATLAGQDAAFAKLDAGISDRLSRIEGGMQDMLERVLSATEIFGDIQNLSSLIQDLALQIATGPQHSETLLREVTDIRSGLTELRVQMRMVEAQVFALNRGYDTTGLRSASADPLAAMLAEVLAARQPTAGTALAS